MKISQFCSNVTKNLEIGFHLEIHFIKFVPIYYPIVLGKCDKKYYITSLAIFNNEGGIETETWEQWILVINTITQILKKYLSLKANVEKMLQRKFLLYFWFSIRYHCENGI